ncbi:hypothetical protein H2248_005346 [Termitomyces sp. 'cryptogamus']|nr:hypothetical protein H2248_005346 [Termitomyces sp. 'cryptogamus']
MGPDSVVNTTACRQLTGISYCVSATLGRRSHLIASPGPSPDGSIPGMASLNRPNAGAHEELYDAGMIFRKKVMGDDYVDNQLAKGTSEFMRPMQEIATEVVLSRVLLT